MEGPKLAIEHISHPMLVLNWLAQDNDLTFVVVDFETGHFFEAHEDKFQVYNLSLVELAENKSIVSVLQVRHPPGIRCGTTPAM
jgi:hypothetical protein